MRFKNFLRTYGFKAIKWFVLFYFLSWSLTLQTSLLELNELVIQKTKNPIILFFRTTFDVLTIQLPVYSVVLLLFFIWLLVKLYNQYPIGNKFKIISAKYGVQGTFMDITNALNSRINHERLEVDLSNEIAGDPARGFVKEVRIRYFF